MKSVYDPRLLVGLLATLVAVLLIWTLVRQTSPDSGVEDVSKSASVTAPAAIQAGPPRPSLSVLPAKGLSDQRPQQKFASLLGGVPDPARMRADRARIADELERGHRAEPVDPAWAGRAEPTLNQLAASPEIAVSELHPDGLKAECRSSTCRISGTFNSNSDAEQWGMLLVTGTGKTFRQTRTVVVPTGDGKYELRIYGVRR